MIKIKNEGIILEKTGLEFENQAVLNPGCIEKDGIVHMFYRAVHTGNNSSIGYCQFKNKKLIYRSTTPVITAEYDYERHGVEDPRIVYLDGIYYLFYVAYDGVNARTALAISTDMITFQKQGIISTNMTYDKAEDLFTISKTKSIYSFFEKLYRKSNDNKVLLWAKDAFIFPKKVNGQFAMLLRILPGIQIVYFDRFSDLTEKFWSIYLTHLKKYIVLEPKYEFENYSVGGGCPPIETEKGWLLIYHGIQEKNSVKTYRAGVALLDKDNPTKVIGRLKHPLFGPEEAWEKKGDVGNVVFPSAAIINGKDIDIYYGAADTVIALKKIDLESLLEELTKK